MFTAHTSVPCRREHKYIYLSGVLYCQLKSKLTCTHNTKAKQKQQQQLLAHTLFYYVTVIT